MAFRKQHNLDLDKSSSPSGARPKTVVAPRRDPSPPKQTAAVAGNFSQARPLPDDNVRAQANFLLQDHLLRQCTQQQAFQKWADEIESK
jgi:hypothetical protein